MRNVNIRNVTTLFVISSAFVFSACPPAYPKCSSDANCAEHGEVCVQGDCRECATDGNCKPGFQCEANKCVPKPECVDDTGCNGKKCKQGKCVVEKKAECSAAEDCPSGQDCKGGRCVAAEVKAPTCTLDPIHFDFNDFSLTGSAQSTLSQYADCIKKGALKVTLEGHADERGTEEYNMVLSQKRAASVRKYLVDLGVSGPALDTVGFGENKPAMQGSNEEAWAANRRVEFKKH